MDNSPIKTRPIWPLAALAGGIVAAQVLLAMGLSGQFSWQALYQWDGAWFRSVVVDGYHFPAEPTREVPGNVAFFPAYPLLAKPLTRLGIGPEASLLVVAQGMAFGSWFYFLLLLRQWNVSARTAGMVTILLAAHPGAFFLVASYSESTFLCGLLGFLYWCGRTGPTALMLAAAHGIVMTAGRVVGLPCVVFPLLLGLSWRNVLLAGLASLGAVAYFAYLQLAFGRWDAFAAAHAAGWDVHPDPLAFFRFRTWGLKYAEVLDLGNDPEALSRMTVPITAAHFLILGVMEVIAGRQSRWRQRWPLYVIAVLLFAMPVVSHATRGMSSLFRFAIGWHAVLALTLGTLLDDGPPWFRSWWTRGVLAAGTAWAFLVQVGMLLKFTRGTFVA